MKNSHSADSTAKSGQRGPVEHERRQQILGAAYEYFRHYGYRKTTVVDLAKEIGFSSAYIYKFFDSKEAIGIAVCSHCLGEILFEIEQAIAQGPSPVAGIRQVFQGLAKNGMKALNKEKKIYDLVSASFEENWPCLHNFNEAIFEMIRKLVVRGRETGIFERKTPLDETCRAICHTTQPFFHPMLLEQNNNDIDEDATAVANLVLRSLSS
jgi:AcrR family transcriptional regulator